MHLEPSWLLFIGWRTFVSFTEKLKIHRRFKKKNHLYAVDVNISGKKTPKPLFCSLKVLGKSERPALGVTDSQWHPDLLVRTD